MEVVKDRGKLIFTDGSIAIVDLKGYAVPVDLELGGHLFKLSTEQKDNLYWIYIEKPGFRLDLH